MQNCVCMAMYVWLCMYGYVCMAMYEVCMHYEYFKKINKCQFISAAFNKCHFIR